MQLCIYCQANPAKTGDHVPPKGLFPKPRPSNLITVPACENCNKGFKRDDEYFLNIALEWIASESSDGGQIAEKQLRAMRRQEARKFWQLFLTKAKPVEVQSPSGLYLSNSLEIWLDGARVFATIKRIVKGLYFEVMKTPLPVNATIVAMQFSEYLKNHKDPPEMIPLMQAIPQLPGGFIGRDTFEFRYFIHAEDPFVSFWYLQFYRRHGFVGTTRPAGVAPKQPEVLG